MKLVIFRNICPDPWYQSSKQCWSVLSMMVMVMFIQTVLHFKVLFTKPTMDMNSSVSVIISLYAKNVVIMNWLIDSYIYSIVYCIIFVQIWPTFVRSLFMVITSWLIVLSTEIAHRNSVLFWEACTQCTQECRKDFEWNGVVTIKM